MTTNLEQLNTKFYSKAATVAGEYLYECLCGFAEILDSVEPGTQPDIDLVDVYMVVGMKNGLTLQITGQITDIRMDERYNTVILHVTDRKTFVMPNSVFIFSLNEVVTVQSLDIVSHQKRIEASAKEEAVQIEEPIVNPEPDLPGADPTREVETNKTIKNTLNVEEI